MSVGKSCLILREGIFKENLESTVNLSIFTFNVKINDKKKVYKYGILMVKKNLEF